MDYFWRVIDHIETDLPNELKRVFFKAVAVLVLMYSFTLNP